MMPNDNDPCANRTAYIKESNVKSFPPHLDTAKGSITKPHTLAQSDESNKSIPEHLEKKEIFYSHTLFNPMITMGIYCTHRWIDWQDEMLSFKNLQINSKIIGLKDLNRGNYEITCVVKDSVMKFDLPIAYEARQDSIAIGDSLSKEAQNGRFEIFRLDEKEHWRKIYQTTNY